MWSYSTQFMTAAILMIIMKIGIPKETKILEGRVAITPSGCTALIHQGNQVFIESGAGELSGYNDEEYSSHGVCVLANAASLYEAARLIVKVKEPLESDLSYLQKDHILFCYLHLAANIALTYTLCDIGLTAIAFETVTDDKGRLPLLKPMSEIAGALSIQIGTQLLHAPQGGKGIMLGGLSITDPGHVVVLGAGVAGTAAARLAVVTGARVTLIDKNKNRFKEIAELYSNITGYEATDKNIELAVCNADLLVGAVLLPGLQAPRLVTESLVRRMQSGSVIIDISVDQGGCIETIKPTNYSKPTYKMHDVLHFGVTNMPGAVPRTASQALSTVILPYVQRLCEDNWQQYKSLQDGINVRQGKIDNPLIEQALNV